MLSFPKKYKYSKRQKGKKFNKVNNLLNLKTIKFNSVKLISLSAGRIKATQLLAIKMLINKGMKKIGKVKIPIFPQNPISKKPIEIRMGKGKGATDHWVCNVTVGISICEVQTTHLIQACNVLKIAQHRLPIKTKIIYYQ